MHARTSRGCMARLQYDMATARQPRLPRAILCCYWYAASHACMRLGGVCALARTWDAAMLISCRSYILSIFPARKRTISDDDWTVDRTTPANDPRVRAGGPQRRTNVVHRAWRVQSLIFSASRNESYIPSREEPRVPGTGIGAVPSADAPPPGAVPRICA